MERSVRREGDSKMTVRLACFVRLTLALTLALTAACGRDERVHSWLVCLDCLDGELDSVVVQGAVDDLGDALLEGPSAALQTNMRRQFQHDYRQLAEYAAAHPEDSLPVGSESEYVGRLLSNFVATYQARGAYALGRIRTPAALDLLRAVLERDSLRDYPPSGPYRADVLEVVSEALGPGPGQMPPPSAPPAVIRGRVTDTDLMPLARAQVYLRYKPVGVVTGNEGEYLIDRVSAGAYTVIATRADHFMAQYDTAVAAGDTLTLNFELIPR